MDRDYVWLLTDRSIRNIIKIVSKPAPVIILNRLLVNRFSLLCKCFLLDQWLGNWLWFLINDLDCVDIWNIILVVIPDWFLLLFESRSVLCQWLRRYILRGNFNQVVCVLLDLGFLYHWFRLLSFLSEGLVNYRLNRVTCDHSLSFNSILCRLDRDGFLRYALVSSG